MVRSKRTSEQQPEGQRQWKRNEVKRKKHPTEVFQNLRFSQIYFEESAATEMAHRLSPLFDFSTIAMVGASDSNDTGLRPFKALQTLGFNGHYYPVNSRREEVHGQRAYPTVSRPPETPDMVVIAIPREGVPDVIDQCAERGVAVDARVPV